MLTVHQVTASGENAKHFPDRHGSLNPVEPDQHPQACSSDTRLWVYWNLVSDHAGFIESFSQEASS
jgi:hypothetical protein